jgi:hypothetical protein
MIKKPASVLAVRPILRFTGDRTIQLDGFETVLSAILVHKTAHERMLVVSGTIWILKHRRCLRGLLCSSRDQPIERPPHVADPTRTDGEGDNECAAPQIIVLHGPPDEGAQKQPCRYPTPRPRSLQAQFLVAFASARPIFSWLAQLGPGRAGATLPMSRRRPPK